MKEFLRILLDIGLVLITFVILIFDITSLKLLILIGISGGVAFTVTGIQIFLDRKNLEKMDELDNQDKE